jgi:P27 family predicted phage terminase small subunit
MSEKRKISIPPLIKKDRVASKYWNDTIPLLQSKDIITELDIALLTNYCLAYANAMRMEYFLKENGQTVKVGTKGYTQVRPEVAIARESWKDVRTCADRLGLSPMARKKINMDEGDEEDDFLGL